MRKSVALILLIVFAVIIAATIYGTLFAGRGSSSPSILPAVQQYLPTTPWYAVVEASPCGTETTIYLSYPPKCMTADGLRVMEPQGLFIVPIENLDR